MFRPAKTRSEIVTFASPVSLPRIAGAFALLCAVVPGLVAQVPGQIIPTLPPVHARTSDHGMEATIGAETLSLTVCSDSIVHVATRPDGQLTEHPQPWLLAADQGCKGAPFEVSQTAKEATLSTAQLRVTLSLERGNLVFKSADGKEFLREWAGVPRTYAPETLNGESTYHVIDRFSPDETEAIYGLGQHQAGLFNYRGATVKLGQNNTDIAIPFLTSTRGYGLLWNSASLTYFDNRFPRELSIESLAADGVDYFVVYGPEMDAIIHGYRSLTGHTPMLPRWAYGFIQSKDHYISLDEIQTIADRYRQEHIPLDVMVQDWFWWEREGDPQFNSNYHDVPGDLKKLHAENIHTMISTWGLLDTRSETYKAMDAKGFLVPNAHTYDASIAAARDLYFEHLQGPLLKQGWDSFWLDSAEPEEYWPHSGDAILSDRRIGIGNGALYTNIYPLLHNQGIQEHWRATNDGKRVFLLTRSAFLGSQRVGGTVWSGDVYSSYWGLSHQVAAGLNYALTGLPYWTTDIGGYWPTYPGQLDDPAYQELYLRWFQFGVFCPVFRSHGHRPHNEMWTYPLAEPTLIQYDKLRYRMMPYLYSLAWKVSSEDYTLQRPLVMDFRADPQTWNIGDQFLFGPAIMVSPVLEAKARERRVYLPEGTSWYDFWTGEAKQGGQYIESAAPLERIPLYVRAGSLLPLGPDEEYAGEKPNGPIELRIYPGADGQFTLYQDEGDGYDYEKGSFSTIPLAWSDATKTLTLGVRSGSYPGMPAEMTFRISRPTPKRGVGQDVDSNPEKTVTYRGAAMQVRLK